MIIVLEKKEGGVGSQWLVFSLFELLSYGCVSLLWSFQLL